MNSFVITYYVTVVLIWSTTPLAIAWSQGSFNSLQALFWRMFSAWLVVFGYLVLRRELPRWTTAYLVFVSISGGGLFMAMALIYSAAPYISSGLIAVLHGLLPMFTALFALPVLGSRLSTRKWLALMVGFFGMLVLLFAELALDTTMLALLGVLVAVAIHALTAVLIKKLGVSVAVSHQLFGSLTVVSVACFIWILLDTSTFLPTHYEPSSIISILYLALIGSIAGFFCYYSLLKTVSPVTVGTITLLTPILSMLVGNFLNGEAFSMGTITGTLILLAGLAGYLRETT